MISVIIPAFREGANVERSVAEIDRILLQQKEGYEILLIDDGSPDDTFAQAKALEQKYPALRALKHSQNQGPGAAFRTGFAASKGDKVITIDCDLSFDPTGIPNLLEKLDTHDCAIGAQHRGGKMVNVPWRRIFFSKLAFVLDSCIFGGGLASYSSFFAGYRGDLIRSLHFDGNGFDAQCEIYVRLMRQGARLGTVPSTLAWKDKKRKSSMRIGREGKKRIKLWWRLHRFRTLSN